MNAGSMPIPIISEASMVQEFRKYQLMPDLHVPTAMAQKEPAAAHTVTMMHSIHRIASLKNQLPADRGGD